MHVKHISLSIINLGMITQVMLGPKIQLILIFKCTLPLGILGKVIWCCYSLPLWLLTLLVTLWTGNFKPPNLLIDAIKYISILGSIQQKNKGLELMNFNSKTLSIWEEQKSSLRKIHFGVSLLTVYLSYMLWKSFPSLVIFPV